MRRPFIIIITLFVFILQACGLENRALMEPMTEDQAIDTLMEIPVDAGRNVRGRMSNLSGKELQEILENLVSSGKIKLESGQRGALGGGTDLSALTDIFSLLQSGQANSLFGLASGLVNMNNGSTGGTQGKLDIVMQLLQAAMPFIMILAPQYAPIIQALMVIVPLVIQIIGMFKGFKKA